MTRGGTLINGKRNDGDESDTFNHFGICNLGTDMQININKIDK